MNSKRKEIRQKLKELLIAADTSAGRRVYSSKKTPIEHEDVPSICIYLPEENYTPHQRTGRGSASVRYRYDIEVTVEIYATESDFEALADTLDDDLQAVHDAILEDNTLGGLVNNIMPMSAATHMTTIASSPVGGIQAIYNLAYFD